MGIESPRVEQTNIVNFLVILYQSLLVPLFLAGCVRLDSVSVDTCFGLVPGCFPLFYGFLSDLFVLFNDFSDGASVQRVIRFILLLKRGHPLGDGRTHLGDFFRCTHAEGVFLKVTF